ncbi:threonylcarbamoyl-AMP synthase [Halostella sp. JP-L12]|uniref:L-threonylcarbamoyladenylate synthase n=1 Tax=Halostella TaxID=1843185 RepID=UPI000EF7DE63|nr:MULTISPECIES: L-threonylcarbamoyladenylate synthase [Halostella]NHN46354.1 threonylcarbamoyl-AMP synthase [Halostella sp. JP-L12]
MSDVTAAAAAVRDGELVVYPTETVYGLGADALDPDAVERAFAAKGRDRSKPLSLGVPDADTALSYVRPTERAERFMREFLPGPVTVVCERTDDVPDALTAGSDRVGVRVPDHDLARELLAEAGPLTATSANLSGRGSVTRVDDLSAEFLDAVAVVLDAGETPGTESTVVDVANDEILRRGANADAIEAWLREH